MILIRSRHNNTPLSYFSQYATTYYSLPPLKFHYIFLYSRGILTSYPIVHAQLEIHLGLANLRMFISASETCPFRPRSLLLLFLLLMLAFSPQLNPSVLTNKLLLQTGVALPNSYLLTINFRFHQ